MGNVLSSMRTAIRIMRRLGLEKGPDIASNVEKIVWLQHGAARNVAQLTAEEHVGCPSHR